MKRVKKGIILLIISALFIMPFSVFADEDESDASGTYWINTDQDFIFNVTGNNQAHVYSLDENVRFVLLETSAGSNYYRWTAVSKSSNTNVYYFLSYPNANPSRTETYALNSSTTIDNVTYYYYAFNGSYSKASDWNVPAVNDKYTYQNAVYYTFGEGAIDPEEPTNYGELVVGFSTKFSRSGVSGSPYQISDNTNLDVIQWENFDSNGNDLQLIGASVEIRAVPILWEAASEQLLFGQLMEDALILSNSGLTIWQGNFNDNHHNFLWGDVIHDITTSTPAFTLHSLFTGSMWVKYGWLYQIRYFVPTDNYQSEWQTIYTSTTISVSDSEKIVNQYYYNFVPGLDPDTVDTVNQVNNYNNTTENWYVENYTINGDDGEVDGDKPWWVYILEAILDIFGKILEFLGGLIDSILDLFRIESFELPDFNTNMNNLLQNTGIFGQSLQFTEQLHEYINDAQAVDPILYYPGFELMDVQLIPELTFNLNDYVASADLTDMKNMAYLVTDGFIYLCLIILVHRKVVAVLKK